MKETAINSVYVLMRKITEYETTVKDCIRGENGYIWNIYQNETDARLKQKELQNKYGGWIYIQNIKYYNRFFVLEKILY